MTHFAVWIALETEPYRQEHFDSLHEAIAEQLEPFDEKGELFKDGSRWDWWVCPGRWKGFANLLNRETALDLRKASNAMSTLHGHDGELFLTGVRFLHQHNWHERVRAGWFGDEAKTECEIRGKEVKRCRWKDQATEAIITCWNEDEDTWRAKWVERFIEPLKPGTMLVLVDCHV